MTDHDVHGMTNVSTAISSRPYPSSQGVVSTSEKSSLGTPTRVPMWNNDDPDPTGGETQGVVLAPSFEDRTLPVHPSHGFATRTVMNSYSIHADDDSNDGIETYDERKVLLTCAFNQDGGCLAVGTTSGFTIHNVFPTYSVSVNRQLTVGGIGAANSYAGSVSSAMSSPPGEGRTRPVTPGLGGVSCGGIGRIEMLFRCNIIAFVGGGPAPYTPPHRVMLWDDHVSRNVGELSFRQVVLRIRLRKDTIAVALRDRIYVYHLADLSLRDKIYTADNPHGLLCLSTQIREMVLACPSVTPGHVRVELYGLRKTVLLEAHESALRGLALMPDGSKLATASGKGTVIRVWDIHTASCLQEFRRGVERADITALAFSWNDSWLAVASDKGTVHVFQLDASGTKPNAGGDHKNASTVPSRVSTTAKSTLSPASTQSTVSSLTSSITQMLYSTVRKSVEGVSDSTRCKSVCQIRGVPHPLACAFVADAQNLLAIAGWDADGNGVLLLSEFSPDNEARRVGYHVICHSAVHDASEEAKRRRRLRGWIPEIPQTPEGGRLYVGERLEVLEQQMEKIHFEETGQDEFISVTTSMKEIGHTTPRTSKPSSSSEILPAALTDAPCSAIEGGYALSSLHTDNASSQSKSTVGDSVQTEPLDEQADDSFVRS